MMDARDTQGRSIPGETPPWALFLTPILPAPGGNGLAMRAGVLLEALARDHRVLLWVVPLASGGSDLTPGPWIRRLAKQVVVTMPEEEPRWRLISRLKDAGQRKEAQEAYPKPRMARFATSTSVARLREEIGARPVERCLVLRSYLAPFALAWASSAKNAAGARPRLILDLDDDESLTRRRLATLRRELDDPVGAETELSEADRFESLERSLLPQMNQLLVAHRGYAERLSPRFGEDPDPSLAVTPNAIRVPQDVPPRPPGPELRLLLVGNLSYLPNQDAARRLALEILPAARRHLRRPVRVRIIGSNPPAAVLGLGEISGVEVWPDVPDVAPHYAWADAAMVPLRAGGGTRIKILEAFAHRVPVVSTPLGAEGLEVVADRHALLAEECDELAAGCVRLCRDPGLRERLMSQALALVEKQYERHRVIESLREVIVGDPST